MNDIIHPIHRSAVGLANLRLFRSPLSGPQQPWHSQEDLFACLTLPRDLRRHFTRSMKKDYGKDVRTVMTVDGPTTIAPHWAAQGFIGAMREVGHEPEGFEHAYVIAITEAMKVLTEGMSPEDSLNYTSRPSATRTKFLGRTLA